MNSSFYDPNTALRVARFKNDDDLRRAGAWRAAKATRLSAPAGNSLKIPVPTTVRFRRLHWPALLRLPREA